MIYLRNAGQSDKRESMNLNRLIQISQNQSANLVSVKWEMVKLETSPGAKTVDKAG